MRPEIKAALRQLIAAGYITTTNRGTIRALLRSGAIEKLMAAGIAQRPGMVFSGPKKPPGSEPPGQPRTIVWPAPPRMEPQERTHRATGAPDGRPSWIPAQAEHATPAAQDMIAAGAHPSAALDAVSGNYAGQKSDKLRKHIYERLAMDGVRVPPRRRQPRKSTRVVGIKSRDSSSGM